MFVKLLLRSEDFEDGGVVQKGFYFLAQSRKEPIGEIILNFATFSTNFSLIPLWALIENPFRTSLYSLKIGKCCILTQPNLT
jgi:hypothetical protein